MSGVEGYVESAASGLMAGLNAVSLTTGEPILAAPRTTAIGALAYYVSHADPAHYNPSNITFGIMPPLDRPPKSKVERKQALSDRALTDLATWHRARGCRDRESLLTDARGLPPAVQRGCRAGDAIAGDLVLERRLSRLGESHS
jgi:hypothetical protein